jgi:transcription initiation factor TFIIIB Brf1 subunit/transcription initiation factor TFIIB
MKCPNCKLSGAYIRRRTNEIVCRMCGVNTKYEELHKVEEKESGEKS